MYNEYEIGDLIRMDVDITISGSHVDPNHLSVYVTRPDERVDHFIYGQTGAFGKETVGKYYLDYYADISGQYAYRFYSSGTAWGAEVKRYVVKRE